MQDETTTTTAQDAENFGYSAGFQPTQDSGSVRLGRLEAIYEELFAEVIEDGVITPEERRQLEKLADNLGLDRGRLRRLEGALQSAWELRTRVTILEVDEGPVPSVSPLAPANDLRTVTLERRIRELEVRVAELETELEEARSMASIDVDLSDLKGVDAATEADVPTLQKRLRHDPRDTETLRALYAAAEQRGASEDTDRRYVTAQILSFLGAGTSATDAFFASHRPEGLVRPARALASEAWKKLLFHPDEEPVVGDIFAVIASAVLVGRVAALRREKQLEKPAAESLHDPATSTVQAVRAFAWAAASLGLTVPPLFVDPEWIGTAKLLPGVPPATKIGRLALSGTTAKELAFTAGRYLAHFREEHFLKLLLPSVKTLEDVFLASLSIGNPGLPLAAPVKALVQPIASAIEPLLEPAQIDRLRGHFLRFVEDGGRANLQRWSQAVDFTAARSRLLLADDFSAAAKILRRDDPAHAEEKLDDLLAFATSDRYGRLRTQLGIAIGA